MEPEALVRRLQASRRDRRWAVIEGYHAVKHALRFGAHLEVLAVAEDVADADLPPEVAERDIQPVRVPAGTLARALPRPPPLPVVGLARRPAVDLAAALARRGAPVVLLERPAHLGNVGAAVRVAAAAGADALVATGVDPWHPVAIRGGAGLQFALPTAGVDELPDTPRPVVAFDPDGADLGALPADALLAFGTERAGLSGAVRSRADRVVRIPMRPGVSSLNLATAVAVALYAPRE